MGQLSQAQQAFERILSLNPNDNQGVRFCWNDVRGGGSWDEMQAREAELLAASGMNDRRSLLSGRGKFDNLWTLRQRDFGDCLARLTAPKMPGAPGNPYHWPVFEDE